MAASDLQVGREASTKEDACEAPNSERRRMRARSHQGTREETFSSSTVDKVGQDVVEPGHGTCEKGRKGKAALGK